MPPPDHDVTMWTGSEVFFNFGKNADGFWGGEHTLKQCMAFLDEHEFFFPGRQALVEFDHSSGHLKKGDDALCTGKMCVKYGGKQITSHSTVLTSSCVGDAKAELWRSSTDNDTCIWSHTDKPGYIHVDCRLYAGQTQDFVHTAEGPPPHWKLDAPRYDGDVMVYDKKTKTQKSIFREGFVGKSIGKSTAVFQRGLFVAGMTDAGNLGVSDPTIPKTDATDDEENETTEREDPYDYPGSVPGHVVLTNWRAEIKAAQETKSLYLVLCYFILYILRNTISIYIYICVYMYI